MLWPPMGDILFSGEVMAMFCMAMPPIPLLEDIMPLPLGIMPLIPPLLLIPLGIILGRPLTGGSPLMDPLGLIIRPEVMGGLPGPLLLIPMLLITRPLLMTTPPLPLPGLITPPLPLLCCTFITAAFLLMFSSTICISGSTLLIVMLLGRLISGSALWMEMP